MIVGILAFVFYFNFVGLEQQGYITPPLLKELCVLAFGLAVIPPIISQTAVLFWGGVSVLFLLVSLYGQPTPTSYAPLIYTIIGAIKGYYKMALIKAQNTEI